MYLSRALRALNLPARVLFLLTAASRRFLVDRGTRMGGSTGVGGSSFALFPVGVGGWVAGGAVRRATFPWGGVVVDGG